MCVPFLGGLSVHNCVCGTDLTVFQCFFPGVGLPPGGSGWGLGTCLVITAGGGLLLAAKVHPRDPPECPQHRGEEYLDFIVIVLLRKLL